MKALIIENDDVMAQKLIAGLRRHGVQAVRAPGGWDIVNALRDVDVVVLNIRQSDAEGLSPCRAVRAMSHVPIIVGSADRDVEGRIRNLQAGADDCLTMPYKISDLVDRMQVVTQRHRPSARRGTTIHRGDVEVNLVSQTASVAGQQVNLARKEFQILALIAAEAGAVCSRERLIAEIWGQPWAGVQDTLNVHVATLRARLGRPGLIETVRGAGYRLASNQAPIARCSAG